MDAFWALLGQIFSIAVIQSVLEMIIDKEKKHYLTILSVACYAVCLYLLVQFVFNNLLGEMTNIFSHSLKIF